MRIQRYMHEHGLSNSTLAKVARKALANGAENENAWRRSPLTGEQVLAAPPGCARSTETSCSCAAQPEAGRGPGSPRTAFTHVYGALGISACTVVSR